MRNRKTYQTKKLACLILLFVALLNFKCTKVENIIAPSNTVPSSPTNLKAIIDSNLITGEVKIKLSWNPPNSNGGSSLLQYIIYKGTSANSLIIYAYTDPDSLYIIDQSVTIGTGYYYAVSAKNESGESTWSNVVNIIPSSYKFYPTEPTNLTCLYGGNIISIKWGAPISNGGSPIVNYKIYKGSDSINLSLYRVLNSSIQSYIDSSVNNFGQNYYQMSATNHLYEGFRTSIIHVSENQQIFFTISGTGNSNDYTFHFRPSEDTRLSKVVASLPSQQFVDTLVNNNPNYIYHGDSTYNLQNYIGIQSGQAWKFQFTGNKIINNEGFIVTSNFIVP